MNKNFFFILLLFFIVVPMSFGEVVVQQLPVTQSNGIVIETPIFTHIQFERNNSFYWNVYNLSSGLILGSDDVDCVFRIFDKDGLVFENLSAYGSILVNESVLTHIGDYSRFIQCNTSVYGDFNELSFWVGYNELDVETEDAIINSILLLILVIFFIASLTWAFMVDGDDKFTMGPSGERILEINNGKYIKLFLYLVSYLFFWMLTWVSWQVSSKFMISLTFSGILRVIFLLETVFWFPLIIGVVVIGLTKHFADSEILNLSKRGLKPR